MSPDEYFSRMAERIKATAEDEFAGAIVVVPPEGEPLAFMLTDTKRDIVHFWTAAKTRVDIATTEAQIDRQNRDPWRR